MRQLLYPALLLALLMPAVAQTYTPAKVLFTGATGLSNADLLMASGLQAGKPMSKEEIEKAMSRLDETGLFADIRYVVDARTLTFALTPQAHMVPVEYGNFILWKPEELTPLVHAKLALFSGKVPTTGNFQQTVADALIAVLADRGIKGRVEGILSQGGTVVYSITDPVVRIRKVRVGSVSALAEPKLNEVLESFAATEYDRRSGAAIQQRIQETYLDLGYLDIAVDVPMQSEPVVEPRQIAVDFNTTAHEGAQYRISKIEWPVTPMVGRADFDKAVTLKVGDLASRIEVLSATKRAEGEFTGLGYLDATLTVHPAKDVLAHTIAYTFTAEPGEIYHLLAFTVAGLPDKQRDELTAALKITPGSAYDQKQLSAFLRAWTSGHLAGYSVKLNAAPDRASHDVLLTITFARGGTR